MNLPNNRHLIALATLIFLALGTRSGFADDWPRFRGIHSDGISREKLKLEQGDKPALSVTWRSNVGTGVSSVTVQNGRLFTVGNEDDTDSLFCLALGDGSVIWKHSYPCATDPNEFEGGPTSTPTIDGERVYAISREGDVFCLKVDSGEMVWHNNVADSAGVRIPGWGFAGSPLVVGDRLILNAGDAGVALDKHSGKLLWASADKDSGYSSVVVSPLNPDHILLGSSRSYVCVNVESGQEIWRQRWLTTFGCNAADPIAIEDSVFISSGYNRGSALLRVSEQGVEMVWKNKEMQNQISTSVLVDGHLYGIHGDVDSGAVLRCMRLSDGQVRWSETSLRAGAIAATGQHLIVMSDDGELILADVDPSAFRVLARSRVLQSKCWTTPVLSNERLYCRSVDGDLVCVRVR